MTDVCRSTRGVGGGKQSGGVLRSLAIALKVRQQAAAAVLVIRPMCPRTTLICLPVQRAISGCKERMAAWS